MAGCLLAGCVATTESPAESPAVSSTASVAEAPAANAAGAGASATAPLGSAATNAKPPRRWFYLGTAFLAGDEPQLAYEAFLTSIRIEGLTADALVGAGIASENQGLLTSARRFFEQAIELDPESLTAHNNLGVVLFLLKEYYPARDAFRVAFALSSGRSEIAERNLNRAEAVVAALEAADPVDPAVSHEVVRLGTNEFRIMPQAEAPAEMMGAQ